VKMEGLLNRSYLIKMRVCGLDSSVSEQGPVAALVNMVMNLLVP
jgi:hypothetical protein